MRKLFITLWALLSLNRAEAADIVTPAFTLKLPGDWRLEKASSEDQQSAYSKSLDAGLTTSFVSMKAKPADTERIATKIKDFRLDAEAGAAKEFDLHMTIADPIVVPFSKGHQTAYFGHDNTGRQFRFLGLVTPDKTVSIYIESKSRSQAELESIFNELLKGLLF